MRVLNNTRNHEQAVLFSPFTSQFCPKPAEQNRPHGLFKVLTHQTMMPSLARAALLPSCRVRRREEGGGVARSAGALGQIEESCFLLVWVESDVLHPLISLFSASLLLGLLLHVPVVLRTSGRCRELGGY